MAVLTHFKLFPAQKTQYTFFANRVPDEPTRDRLFDEPPDWKRTPNLIALFDYVGNLTSSSITGLTSPLVGFSFYRRAVNESKMHHICDLPIHSGKVDLLYDYCVDNSRAYIYTVIPITQNALGLSFEAPPARTDWDSWALIALEENDNGVYVADEIWTLRTELSIGDFVQNTDVTVNQGYGKYPQITVGDQKYLSGSLSAVLADLDCETMVFSDTIEKLEAWKAFITSRKKMLVKDTKGQIAICSIGPAPSYTYDNALLGLPTTVRFEFVEVEDYDDARIYKVMPRTMSAELREELHGVH